jgi:hypothetical protein
VTAALFSAGFAGAGAGFATGACAFAGVAEAGVAVWASAGLIQHTLDKSPAANAGTEKFIIDIEV